MEGRRAPHTDHGEARTDRAGHASLRAGKTLKTILTCPDPRRVDGAFLALRGAHLSSYFLHLSDADGSLLRVYGSIFRTFGASLYGNHSLS